LVEWPTSANGSWMEVAPKKKIMKQYLVFKKLKKKKLINKTSLKYLYYTW